MKTISHYTHTSGIKRCLFLMILLPVMFVTDLNAQSLYKLSTAKESFVKISGKSNVHDWNMKALNPVSEADFGPLDAESNVPKSLNALSFNVNAKSLKSEHGSMDTRTYKLIKADDYPKISFKLTSAVITSAAKNKFTVKANGTLTIAGIAKSIVMLVNGEVKADHSITCYGNQAIKLTDYGLQPPSFMLGAMKVANDLNIDYSLNFKK